MIIFFAIEKGKRKLQAQEAGTLTTLPSRSFKIWSIASFFSLSTQSLTHAVPVFLSKKIIKPTQNVRYWSVSYLQANAGYGSVGVIVFSFQFTVKLVRQFRLLMAPWISTLHSKKSWRSLSSATDSSTVFIKPAKFWTSELRSEKGSKETFVRW